MPSPPRLTRMDAVTLDQTTSERTFTREARQLLADIELADMFITCLICRSFPDPPSRREDLLEALLLRQWELIRDELTLQLDSDQ